MRGRTLNIRSSSSTRRRTPRRADEDVSHAHRFGPRRGQRDITQIDLARGQKSGLIEARRILAGVRASRSPSSARRTSCAIRWCPHHRCYEKQTQEE